MKFRLDSVTRLIWPLLAGLLLSGAGGRPHAEDTPAAPVRPPLVVVLDNNYPPYVFRDAHGSVRGILPDQWALWERRTGRKVELRPMDWAEAQRVMREGGADVIDTVFLTRERARTLVFSRPYARIRVPVFAHKSLGGLGDTASLKGFMIGVKAGDAVIEHLTSHGIDTFKEYSGYEEIVLAAKRNEIKVFSVDEPAAVYYLYKHGVAGDFHQLFELYTGAFHRAVARHRATLLAEVEEGFDRISSREYRAIRRKWMGAPFLLRGFLRQWGSWLAGLLAILLLLAAGNVVLGRRVLAKTTELRRALAEARQSLDARLRSEEEKAAMQRQLANAQRLEAVGRLAGAVAHDFNNMLQAILGYSELALEQVPDIHPLHEVIEEIRQSALRSSNLTRQLQAFARRQPLAPQPVNINEAIGNMTSLLHRLLGSNIRLEWRPAADVGSVMLDPGQIDQIVANLCVNARDALDGSGRVEIATCSVDLADPEAARLRGLAPGPCVRLTVRDDGPGIPPEIRDRIFEPFFTTKAPDKGTGLGLAIVYAIVRQNGGAIDVETGGRPGCAFHIYLPCCAASPAAEPALDEAPPPGPRRTILLVEDEESVLLTTRHMLEGLGYRVHHARTPDAALQILYRDAAEIDLLLTDVDMPGMSGPVMARRMLQAKPDLRCLFMSGHAATLIEEQAPDLAAGGCLPKPFSSQTLARQVPGLSHSHPLFAGFISHQTP
jgi:signal transduction histidine kinase